MSPLIHSHIANTSISKAEHPEHRPPLSPETSGRSGLRALDGQECLFDAFIACRTTLEDLALRLAVRGKDHLSVASIAAYLTGRTRLSEPEHHRITNAINARLAELSRPSRTFPYR